MFSEGQGYLSKQFCGFGLYDDKSFVIYGGVYNTELIYLSCKENKVFKPSFSATGESMQTHTEVSWVPLPDVYRQGSTRIQCFFIILVLAVKDDTDLDYKAGL